MSKTEQYINAEEICEYLQTRHKNLCNHYGEADDYCKGYEDAMTAVEHAPTISIEPKIEWISVEDQLPEECESLHTFSFGDVKVITVLVAYNKIIEIRNRVFDGQNWVWSDATHSLGITHWMPLPEAPKNS